CAVATTDAGAPVDRLDGGQKVAGKARYAYEHHIPGAAYCWPVQSMLGKGTILRVHGDAVLAQSSVLAVISHENAPKLKPAEHRELDLSQSDEINYHGQIVAAVVAESLEAARAAASGVRVEYQEQLHDSRLRADHPNLFAPETVNAGYATDSEIGDFEPEFKDAAVRLDATYTTPTYHNNPMEPHAAVAFWDGDRLTVYDSTQAVHTLPEALARLFALPPEQVRVSSEYVGGGFGSKGMAHPYLVLAAIAARIASRPVKVAMTRRELFALAGYRTPTIQRVRLGADATGRLVAIGHDVVEQTSTLAAFAEPTAAATRWM